MLSKHNYISRLGSPIITNQIWRCHYINISQQSTQRKMQKSKQIIVILREISGKGKHKRILHFTNSNIYWNQTSQYLQQISSYDRLLNICTRLFISSIQSTQSAVMQLKMFGRGSLAIIGGARRRPAAHPGAGWRAVTMKYYIIQGVRDSSYRVSRQ